MAGLFEIAVQRLLEVGFYNFLLPFILFVTLFYAILRKSQILGDSTIIQAIISLVFGLFIFGAPVILGVSLVQPLTAFLTQFAVVILVFLIGFLITSFFYPNLMEKLPEIFQTPGPATWLIWVILIFAIFFGLFHIAGSEVTRVIDNLGAPKDLVLLTGVILAVFFIFMLVAYTREMPK